MKVKELVALLLNQDQEALVLVAVNDFGGHDGIDGVSKVNRVLTNDNDEDFDNVVAIELEG